MSERNSHGLKGLAQEAVLLYWLFLKILIHAAYVLTPLSPAIWAPFRHNLVISEPRQLTLFSSSFHVLSSLSNAILGSVTEDFSVVCVANFVKPYFLPLVPLIMGKFWLVWCIQVIVFLVE